MASGAFESRGQFMEVLHQMIQEGIDQLDRGERIPAEEVFDELEQKAKKIVREASKKNR